MPYRNCLCPCWYRLLPTLAVGVHEALLALVQRGSQHLRALEISGVSVRQELVDQLSNIRVIAFPELLGQRIRPLRKAQRPAL